ncbi:biopolymer transporter ExbD [Deferribacterales bacterium RsTz2092]|nr:biopolymer transport protein exbD2 [Deferribacterales bacterium]
MKFHTAASNDSSRLALNIMPLIDVIFILLIFFAVRTSFNDSSELDVDLPQAATAEAKQENAVVRVIITANNSIYVNGMPTMASELNEQLKQEYEKAQNASVVIEADKATQHGVVVSVIDAARSAGFESFAIATDKP